jgi:hypothetical protein
MKKIVFVLAALVFASPALADVNITAAQVGEPCDGRVQISWDATSETNLVRAFGLNVTLDNDANVVSATGLSADYWVYPGTIVIAADGTITDSGSIAAEYSDLPSDTLPGPPDGNGVTLECASLYAPVGPGSPNAPAKSGILAELIINKDCTLCISANVSRAGATGVVMENPDEVVTVNYPPVCLDVCVPGEIECYKGQPDYGIWDAVGKPDCWCNLRQCRGDADGTLHGTPIGGYFWVGIPDLNILVSAWQVKEPPKGAGIDSVPNGICADFDHTLHGTPIGGYFRVGIPDLNILVASWQVKEPPKGPGIPGDCLDLP